MRREKWEQKQRREGRKPGKKVNSEETEKKTNGRGEAGEGKKHELG